MGLFSRKVPAAQGLASVGISTGLTALQILGPTLDGIRLAAVVVGYLKSNAQRWGASEQSMERFIELVWSGLSVERPEIISRFMLFSVDSVQACEFFEARTLEKAESLFVVLGMEGRSKTPERRFCELSDNLCEAADKFANEKSSSWRPS